MRVTIESTSRLVEANGVTCRVWEGKTENGVQITCLIPHIAPKNPKDLTEFEAESRKFRAPSASAVEAFPQEMILQE